MLSSTSSSSFLAAPPLSPRPSSSSPPPSPPSVRFGTVRAFAGGGSTTTAEQQETKTKSKNTTTSYLNIEKPSGVTAESLYEILGIPTGATCQEIKAAYRRLARVCHPDVAATKDSSADKFMKIHAAYSTLSDPAKRADYDRRLLIRRHGRPLTVVHSGFSGYTSRNWETDQCW